MDLTGHKIAVLGAGGSGLAAAKLALSSGAEVMAFDSGDSGKLAAAVERFAEIGVTLTTGPEALVPPHAFSYTVTSPGIDAAWPIAVAFAAVSDEFIGEIEFAYRHCSVPVIAITGTNGKTTTTSLIAEMLQGAGLRAVAAGNIGLAFSEVILSGEIYDWIVLEVSSFQLETIVQFAPDIAVWMNFAPDHMDRYDSIDDYFAAKRRIFENGGESGLAISKREEPTPEGWPTKTFSAFAGGADWSYEDGWIYSSDGETKFHFYETNLNGKHNAENVMVALAVASHIGLSLDAVSPSIKAFSPPAHRCEKVAVVDGVTYVNDSKSTNLHSLESALAGQDSPVVLIVGGKEKGLDFSELTELVSTAAKHCLCIGEIAESIATAWGNRVRCETKPSLVEAVSRAHEISASGDVVLFSPGTSSFDMFSGYEERGQAFADAVASLP